MASTNNILRPLIRSNIALLNQKIALLDLLLSRNGTVKASEQFSLHCPVVQASIGQHYRHSMDHIELAALVASTSSSNNKSGDTSLSLAELHYDLRVRGGTLENDLEMSQQRIVDVVNIFQSLHTKSADNELDESISPVTAYFNLSADSNDEIGLPSTIGRELGFAAHHAIRELTIELQYDVLIVCSLTLSRIVTHICPLTYLCCIKDHMAMCKVIAINTLLLKEEELPHGFGRAPSTLLFDKAAKK